MTVHISIRDAKRCNENRAYRLVGMRRIILVLAMCPPREPGHATPLSCVFVGRFDMLLLYHPNVVASIFYHFLIRFLVYWQ